jgi:hypothetical protein
LHVELSGTVIVVLALLDVLLLSEFGRGVGGIEGRTELTNRSTYSADTGHTLVTRLLGRTDGTKLFLDTSLAHLLSCVTIGGLSRTEALKKPEAAGLG